LDATLKRALALQQQGDLARAQFLYEKILKAEPRHFIALNRLGVIAAQRNDPRKALYLFEKAIDVEPHSAVAHGNRGLALHRLRQLDAALASYEKALAIDFDRADTLMNRANVLKDLQQWDAAMASYNRAIALNPDYAEALSNSAYVLKEQRRLDEALARYDRAIALNPEYVSAHLNRGLTLLSVGDFEHGWADYEWRRRLEPDTRFPQPYWLGGESIAGKTVLLQSEQGLGDTLQFCRYSKLVSDLDSRVILHVQKPLVTLLERLPGVSQVIANGHTPPKFDYRCSLMSLPLAFKTRLDTIPFSAGYLRSDSASVARWRSRLGERTKPLIGLAWSGSKTHYNDRNRSIPLADLVQWLPADFQYVTLQTDIRDPDKQTLKLNPQILDFSAEQADFIDSAALCECMDLVISIDTSIAHLGGALGMETWLLLPYNADWRWLLDRRDSPWYSNTKLYRQSEMGDWNGVFAQLKLDLTRRRQSGSYRIPSSTPGCSP
jgi:tetratricopeptide (TPR) repeat protein